MLNFFHKIFFNPKTNRQGQHVSEYTLLIISVMMGVLIAGPYVIRSWNALLKAYESDVMDSFTDPLKQPPPEGGLCSCDDFAPGECGVTFDGETCDGFERMWYRNCHPIECNRYSGIDISQCRFDPTCCPWENIGCAANGCPIGTMAQAKSCTSETRCKPDPKCQLCSGIYSSGQYWREILCTGDLTNVNNPPQPFIRVENGACTLPVKCEIECQLPYIPADDGSQCICPPGKVDVCVPQPPNPNDTSKCCTPATSCQFISFKSENDFNKPENQCGGTKYPGTYLFVQYEEADSKSSTRSHVRICCPFESVCSAIASRAGPPLPGRIPHPYPTCSTGVETFKMCTGNCNWDDTKVVICCAERPFALAACWDVNGEEYQRRRCGAGSTVIAEGCTAGKCKSDESWIAMCCGAVAPKCTGTLTDDTYEICSNMNSYSGNDGERFSNEALEKDTPWVTINHDKKCALEQSNGSDDVTHKCEVKCKSGYTAGVNSNGDNDCLGPPPPP